MINASFLLCLLLAGATTQLSGRVVDQDDQPVKDAIVVISTAKPRVGPATTCPSCYRDCAKRTLTDDQGRFQISVGKHIRAIDFRFSAAGFAAADVHWLRADKRDVRVELGSGASLRGRLPDKSIVYVGRRKAWRGSTLTLPPVASGVVQINDLGREPVEISVRVPGLKVVSCNPPLNEDLNRRYTIRVDGDTEIVFVVGE